MSIKQTGRGVRSACEQIGHEPDYRREMAYLSGSNGCYRTIGKDRLSARDGFGAGGRGGDFTAADIRALDQLLELFERHAGVGDRSQVVALAQVAHRVPHRAPRDL